MCSVGRVQHICEEHFRVAYPECPEIEVKSQHFSVFFNMGYSNTCKKHCFCQTHFQPCALMDTYILPFY